MAMARPCMAPPSGGDGGCPNHIQIHHLGEPAVHGSITLLRTAGGGKVHTVPTQCPHSANHRLLYTHTCVWIIPWNENCDTCSCTATHPPQRTPPVNPECDGG